MVKTEELPKKTDDIIHLDLEDPHVVEKKDTSKKSESEPVSSNYASYFSLVYWSDFFDVNQTEMIDRLTTAIHPNKMNIGTIIRAKPELYGPFWICSTIVFSIFAFGNLSRFIAGHEYNFDFISSACSLLYGCV